MWDVEIDSKKLMLERMEEEEEDEKKKTLSRLGLDWVRVRIRIRVWVFKPWIKSPSNCKSYESLTCVSEIPNPKKQLGFEKVTFSHAFQGLENVLEAWRK